jgi:hypothetical protein
VEVNELFKDVAKLVHEQGGVIGKSIHTTHKKNRYIESRKIKSKNILRLN